MQERHDRVELLGDMFAKFVRVALCQEVIEGLKQHSITFAHYEILQHIIAQPGQTVGEIARDRKIGYPKATHYVSQLHGLGLVSKRGVRSDRRIARVYPTEKGQSVAASVAKERQRRVKSVMAKMKADEREVFERSLEGFLVAAGKSGIMKEVFVLPGQTRDAELDPEDDSLRL